MIKEIYPKDIWYLLYALFPALAWARLRIFDDGSCEVLDHDGLKYNFISQEDANSWLRQEEYTRLEVLDQEDEEDFGIILSTIKVPNGQTEEEILARMYVHVAIDSTDLETTPTLT